MSVLSALCQSYVAGIDVYFCRRQRLSFSESTVDDVLASFTPFFFQSSEPSDPLSSSVFQRFFKSNLIGLVKLSKPIVKNC